MYHNPVLLYESIEGLSIDPNGIYVDVTFGGGGHSRLILQNLSNGRLLGFDQDSDAVQNAIDDPRFTLINHNFTFLTNFLRLHDAFPVDGILADLGVSSHQFDEGERGFSTRFDAPLDMRMGQNNSMAADEVVNTYSEPELIRVLKEFGELKNAYHVARGIIKAREIKQIATTAE